MNTFFPSSTEITSWSFVYREASLWGLLIYVMLHSATVFKVDFKKQSTLVGGSWTARGWAISAHDGDAPPQNRIVDLEALRESMQAITKRLQPTVDEWMSSPIRPQGIRISREEAIHFLQESKHHIERIKANHMEFLVAYSDEDFLLATIDEWICNTPDEKLRKLGTMFGTRVRLSQNWYIDMKDLFQLLIAPCDVIEFVFDWVHQARRLVQNVRLGRSVFKHCLMNPYMQTGRRHIERQFVELCEDFPL
jgi:hypothetical protein